MTSFSILWWIELVLRGHSRIVSQFITGAFQYPLVDRVGFEGYQIDFHFPIPFGFSILWWIELVLRGHKTPGYTVTVAAFQYPLVDRVGFEGLSTVPPWAGLRRRFSILWWIELVLRGPDTHLPEHSRVVSVSSGGSSWF